MEGKLWSSDITWGCGDEEDDQMSRVGCVGLTDLGFC